MYLDGGYTIDWSRNTTAWVIDVAIGVIICGFSLWMGYKTLVNYFGKKTMKTYITRIGIYTGMASSIANFAMTLFNFSVGGAIAYALDKYDRSGLNKSIQF